MSSSGSGGRYAIRGYIDLMSEREGEREKNGEREYSDARF